MVTKETITAPPKVSIIVPARNEEASLADCLQSLVTQTGIAYEIIVVDDHSTDRTREIASSFPGVRVIEAGPLPHDWTGKNNAVTTGARQAHGDWLLFTDADTIHLPGSLASALKEAEENGAELLSYSPEQIAVTFWEMATLPVVFAELARQYSPSKVSDPASPIAAANGQYILIRRDTYDAVGGHAAIAANILEDVRSGPRREKFRPQDSLPLRRYSRTYAHVPQLLPTPRRLDQELGVALSEPRLARPQNAIPLGIRLGTVRPADARRHDRQNRWTNSTTRELVLESNQQRWRA